MNKDQKSIKKEISELTETPYKILKGSHDILDWILATSIDNSLLSSLPNEFNTNYFWNEFLELTDFNLEEFSLEVVPKKYITQDLILNIIKVNHDFNFNYLIESHKELMTTTFIKKLISKNIYFTNYLFNDCFNEIIDNKLMVYLLSYHLYLFGSFLKSDNMKDFLSGKFDDKNPHQYIHQKLNLILSDKDFLMSETEEANLSHIYFNFISIHKNFYVHYEVRDLLIKNSKKYIFEFLGNTSLSYQFDVFEKIQKVVDIESGLILIDLFLKGVGKEILNFDSSKLAISEFLNTKRFENFYFENKELVVSYYKKFIEYHIYNMTLFNDLFNENNFLDLNINAAVLNSSFDSSETKYLFKIISKLSQSFLYKKEIDPKINLFISNLDFEKIKKHLKISKVSYEYGRNSNGIYCQLIKKLNFNEFYEKLKDELTNDFFSIDFDKIVSLINQNYENVNIKELYYLHEKCFKLKQNKGLYE